MLYEGGTRGAASRLFSVTSATGGLVLYKRVHVNSSAHIPPPRTMRLILPLRKHGSALPSSAITLGSKGFWIRGKRVGGDCF